MERWRVIPEAPPLEIERRADGETEEMQPSIKGYATVYGVKTVIFWGQWREVVQAGAYDESLRVDVDEICTLWQHDSREPLGRVSADTMRVWSDDVGVGYTFDPPGSAANRVESIDRGDVYQSSIGFDVLEDSWAQDEEDEDLWLRTIIRASMWEASPVTWPAVVGTSVGVTDGQRSIEGLALPELPADLRWNEEAGRMRIVRRTQSPGVDVDAISQAHVLQLRQLAVMDEIESAFLDA